MNRREFLLSSAASVAAVALPVSVTARPMRFTDKPCWFAPDWEVCDTCGLTPQTLGIRGLHCGLQKRSGWAVQVDQDGFMHWDDVSGPYIVRSDFYTVEQLPQTEING